MYIDLILYSNTICKHLLIVSSLLGSGEISMIGFCKHLLNSVKMFDACPDICRVCPFLVV